MLRTVQKAIQQGAPDAKEMISYSIPAFKTSSWIFYYSVYTKHYTLSCPPPFTIFEKFKKELLPYEVSKSAIKFPLDEPVPVKLITEMSAFRVKESKELASKK